MRFLIFTQHFPPETVATGRRALDLAEHLAERGHQVTVIAGRPNHPSSLNQPFCRAALTTETASAGYRIVRVPAFRSANPRTLHRFLTYGTFALSAAWAGLRQKPPDVILAVSPLPTGLAALLVHWGRRAPLVFDLQDIWPDSARAVGVMQPSVLLRLLRRLERFFYRRCALIVGTSEGFRQYLLKLGVRPERVTVIHNGVNWRMFAGAEADKEFRREHRLGSDFVVGYAGNIGLAQGLGTLLDAAEVLRNEPVKFLLVGEGTDKHRVVKLARIHGLENLRFLEGVTRDRVASVLAACDALLLILRKDPLFEITIPSKIYEYMAAGKPVICSVGGEAAALVAASQCGLPAAPSDAADLARTVQRLRENPDGCRRMGTHGARAARERYSRRRLMADYAALAESLAPAGAGTVTPFPLPIPKSASPGKP
ncbi:MAG TPA: glycosyltransferase family 4 protein [Terriglobia bacterium]|nr:glycosyltransferase family 4 protein [Terriglobia bacterium]